ncbi:helix-turn-helix domain-containing protein [Bifidobacterium dolichotidis]|nr:helix-turn-helix transcriptional regulator [Bifidobacterium dolichotidis]
MGKHLSVWRRTQRMTAQEMASRAGVSVATISKLENGDDTVSLRTFLNVCHALGCLDKVEEAVNPLYNDETALRIMNSGVKQRIRHK